METHSHLIPRQSKHSLTKVKPGNFIKVCFLLIFTISLFCPPFQTAALAVATPGLLVPSDGVTITATGSGANAWPPVALPEFSWSAVDGATIYRIQISSDVGFSSITYENTTPLTHLIPTDLSPFNDGLWYWRVQVEAPTLGFFSPANSFTKQWASPDNFPVLVSPLDGATLEFYDAPTFSWQPVVGAAGYKFQVASSSNFNFGTITYDQTVAATTHQPPNKFLNGTRYWRVVPIDPAGREGTPSQARLFIMGYNQVPTLLEPADGSYPTFTPTFRWKAVRGAQFYRLQYSTDPTFYANLNQIDTRNTTFTPSVALPNDVNYYWRVRAYSGASETEWSPSWMFRKQWVIIPVLLTPTNGYQHVRMPDFSWTPVPGASFYRFEMDLNTSFVNPLIREDTSNSFYTPKEFNGGWNIVYWRVIPYDANGNRGKESGTFSFLSHYTETVPTLVSPLYYYPPNTFPPPFNTTVMTPTSDRSVSWPIFMWNRLTTPALTGSSGSTFTAAYRVQVSSNPLFSPVLWTVDTQNTHAAPTIDNNFIPIPGQDYFWRVCALDGTGIEIGDWSQTWKARFSLTNMNDTPTAPPPQPRRPLNGSEIVETTPLLEWWSVTGADSYEVEISDDISFTTHLDSGIVAYPSYSPKVSLAQRSLGKINYGTFYWRVRAHDASLPGDWSDWSSPPWRFQIASQSERVEARSLGSASNRLLIAADPPDAEDSGDYQLTSLYAMQDSNYWYVGFNVKPGATGSLTYGLYLDLDHKDNSGAASDPRGYTISTIPAFRPEYAIYIDRSAGAISADNTVVYAWNGTSWDNQGNLTGGGSDLSYDPTTGYVELKLWSTVFGMSATGGSYALSLFSLPASSGQPVDSIPWDPNIPGSGPISRFATVSERMNTITPQYTSQGDPTADPFILPFTWDYPTGSNGTAPWAGNWVKVCIDPDCTNEVASNEERSNTPYYAFTSHHWSYDFIGDNTYYWRIQPCYLFPVAGRVCGVWSQVGRIERKGFVPQNLQESVTFATPTFSWDRVEGAASYQLQVDDNDNFATPAIDITTAQASYTFDGTLPSGKYYWHVKVIRWNNAAGNYSISQTFTLTLPKPSGLTTYGPYPDLAIHTTPTFCWQPLIASSNGVPVLAAWRYVVQVSRGDPTFSNIYDQQETEQSCWTPVRGYDDDTYYWRVAMEDGMGRLGGFSDAAVFTKQYPAAKPFSPVDGSVVSGTPTFSWTAADGVTPYVFGAARYRLQISQVNTFSPIYEQVDTINTRYTPTRLYDLGKKYYWRVEILDRDGKNGPFNNAILIIDAFPFHVYLPSIIKN